MGHKLIHAVGSAAEADQVKRAAAALKTYLGLLESDSDKPADAQAFMAAVQVLGKRPDDPPRDLQVIQEARELQRRVRAGSNLDARRDAANKAVADSRLERERLLAEWAAAHRQLEAKATEVDQLYREGEKAQRDLEAAKRKHGEVLANVELLHQT